MNKRIKIFVGIFLVLIILTMQVSNVIAVRYSATDNGFFYTNTQEIPVGKTLEMIFDISKIKYNEFEFKLSSNLDTNSIIINEEIKAENYSNDISINIDKSKTKLDKITFYYTVPENSQIGTKIELVAQIVAKIEKKNEQTTNTTANTNILENIVSDNANTMNTTNIENSTIDTNTNEISIVTTELENKVVEEKKIEVKIIEKKENENPGNPNGQMNPGNPNEQMNPGNPNEQTNQEKPNKQINNENIPNEQTNQENINQQINKNNVIDEKDRSNSFEKNGMINNNNISISENLNVDKSMLSNKQSISYSENLSSMPLQTETAVYNGSNNNYLSTIEITGETLNTTFNKENTTYFVQTSGKTELDINATAEDDGAKIQVAGNKDLKTGDNKILISVTAENGDVRYYRIFVTNK